MALRAHFFCDYCNPNEETVPSDDEVTAAYTVTDGEIPFGWWEVPGAGREGGVGHACSHCIIERPEVRRDVIARRSAQTDRILGRTSVD